LQKEKEEKSRILLVSNSQKKKTGSLIAMMTSFHQDFTISAGIQVHFSKDSSLRAAQEG